MQTINIKNKDIAIVEIKPFIESWNENKLKKILVTAGAFHTPENSKICFFVWYRIFKYNYFSTRHYYCKASCKYPQKSNVKILYITFWPPRKILVVAFEHGFG